MPTDTPALPSHVSHSWVVVGALVAFGLLLAILFMLPDAISALIQIIERRRPLGPPERARVALAAHYARVTGMNDADLAGLTPRKRQGIWNTLRDDWGIRGMRGRKQVLSRQALDWLRDVGHRADPRLAPPPGNDSDAQSRALLAWDYSRLVFLSRLCFFAGYIDEQAAWQYIDAAARGLSAVFDSWPAYGAALLMAREYSTGKGGTALADAIGALLAEKDSPWGGYLWSAAVATAPPGSLPRRQG
jgi:hypothetical protein